MLSIIGDNIVWWWKKDYKTPWNASWGNTEMIGDINDYCIICGIRLDRYGDCPNCTTKMITMEEVEREYPEFRSTIPEEYRQYLAKDVRE